MSRIGPHAPAGAACRMKVIYPIGIVGALIGALIALAAAAPAAPAAAPAPKIAIDHPVYDFGTALEGRFVTHTFRVKNAGNANLLLNGLHTSCGCTAASPSKERLAPGETADLQVTFDTRFQKGHRVRTITIFSNDPDSRATVVTLQGDVRVEVEATPSEVNFDKVKFGAEASREVTISDLTKGKDFSLGDVTNASRDIKVTRQPRKDHKPGAVLDVKLLAGMPIGSFDDTINIVTNRQPIQVHVFGRVVGDLTLDPAQVSFGIVPHGQGVLRILKLSNAGAQPVKVTGVTSSNSSVAAKVEPITAGKEYKITVELRRNTPDGQLRGQLAIRTDDPRQATLTVPFYAIVGSFES